MIIKRVQIDDRICEFTDIEFSNYATDCNVELNFEEFCFVAEDNGNIAGVIIGRAYYNEIHIGDLEEMVLVVNLLMLSRMRTKEKAMRK